MSKIQRYRVNPVMWVSGKGWTKTSIHDKPAVHAIEQEHKKGGWCKWSDVQKLKKQLDEARYSATDYAMNLGRAKDELAEAREENESLEEIKRRGFDMLKTAYEDYESFKPMFESLVNMVKEELKEKGDE